MGYLLITEDQRDKIESLLREMLAGEERIDRIREIEDLLFEFKYLKHVEQHSEGNHLG